MSKNISCTGEVYITRKANHSPAFLFDLHLERLAVSLGKDQTEAIDELQKCEIRQFSPRITEELEECLGHIAAGTCQIYPTRK